MDVVRRGGPGVRYRFDAFELDPGQCELRRAGRVCQLQPRVFAILEYLVRHRDRVVPKAELLAELWPGVLVTDGSVQRAISLARTALKDDGSRIRTIPKQGYRFVGRVKVDRTAVAPVYHDEFQPRFVRSGDAHIAYYTTGEGPIDLVFILGWVMSWRTLLEHAEIAALMKRLSGLGRVILFDKRGTGLSDRVKSLPTVEQRVDDLRAVLDAVGSTDAILIGTSEGGALALVYAATMPERLRGLILVSTFARWPAAPDHPHGWTPEMVQRLRTYISTRWGHGDSMRPAFASHASDPATIAWAARAEIAGASPGAALDVLDMNLQLDVRPVVPTISVPTVVLHNRHDAVCSVENGRYLAAHIPGARLVEVDTNDHTFVFEGADAFVAAVDSLLTEPRPRASRFLTTIVVLVTDAAATELAALEDMAARFKGIATGESCIWSFDGPQRAVLCAHALRAQLGTAVRGAVHAGEAVRDGARLRGEAIDSARAIARAATPGEVWVSRVVRDLLHGSPFGFAARRAVTLHDGRSLETLASEPAVEIRKR
jgi:pimeloyl-ACP methyl ester carboxylesterase/DNA-binding winged helix-turn-helix (wHTH) protein